MKELNFIYWDGARKKAVITKKRILILLNSLMFSLFVLYYFFSVLHAKKLTYELRGVEKEVEENKSFVVLWGKKTSLRQKNLVLLSRMEKNYDFNKTLFSSLKKVATLSNRIRILNYDKKSLFIEGEVSEQEKLKEIEALLNETGLIEGLLLEIDNERGEGLVGYKITGKISNADS